MHKFYNECLAKQPEQKNQHLVFKKYEGLTVLPVEKPKDSSAPAKFHCGAQAGFSGSHPACSYDDAVRMSKTMLDLARGCEKICLSGDQECKRDLLKLVINHRFSTASAKTSASRIAMHQRLKTIRSPSSVLPDRDPNAPNSKPRIPTGIDSIFANGSLSDQKADMDLLYRDEKATIFSQEAESPEASLLDPKTPRPETPSFFRANREENDSSRIHSDLSQVAQFCLSLSEEDLEVIDHMEPAKKKAALESAELGRFLEKTWPASKAVIAKEILRISEERELSEMLDCLQKGPAGQPNLAGVFALAESNELQQLTSKEPEAMFLHYCGSCHNERSTYKLPLNDLEKLKTYESFLFGSIKKALEKKEMPPKSPLAPELSEEDRKILLEFLR